MYRIAYVINYYKQNHKKFIICPRAPTLSVLLGLSTTVFVGSKVIILIGTTIPSFQCLSSLNPLDSKCNPFSKKKLTLPSGLRAVCDLYEHII